jgi:hypothetical protein
VIPPLPDVEVCHAMRPAVKQISNCTIPHRAFIPECKSSQDTTSVSFFAARVMPV